MGTNETLDSLREMIGQLRALAEHLDRAQAWHQAAHLPSAFLDLSERLERALRALEGEVEEVREPPNEH